MSQRNFSFLATLGFISIYMATWEFVLVYATKLRAFLFSICIAHFEQILERRTSQWWLWRPILGLHWHYRLLFICCCISGRNGIHVSRSLELNSVSSQIARNLLCRLGCGPIVLTLRQGLLRVAVSTTGLVNSRLPNTRKLPATQRVCFPRHLAYKS